LRLLVNSCGTCGAKKDRCWCNSTVQKKTKWTAQEDALLLELWGNSSKDVIMQACGRPWKICSDRYNCYVDPTLRLAEKEPFTFEEDQAINKSHQEGIGWTKMAKDVECLNGRSTNDLKNRYNSQMRKRKRAEKKKKAKAKKKKK
jgi:hypothetical protein